MGAIENTRGYAVTPLSLILMFNTLLVLAMASGSHPASLQSRRSPLVSSTVSLQPHTAADQIGEDHSYLILVTDGVTSLMSDQEIVDLARLARNPTQAAKAIVQFGEDLGAEDNCTCIVVPLAGWGQVGGKDLTEERREYRRKQAGELSTRMQRM